MGWCGGAWSIVEHMTHPEIDILISRKGALGHGLYGPTHDSLLMVSDYAIRLRPLNSLIMSLGYQSPMRTSTESL